MSGGREPVHGDLGAGKTTFVRLHGLDASRRLAGEHTQQAVAHLGRLPGDTAFLAALATGMEKRAR